MRKMTLKAARVNAGLTQKDAANALGVSEQTLSNHERGISEPRVSMIEKICKLYGVKQEEIEWRLK